MCLARFGAACRHSVPSQISHENEQENAQAQADADTRTEWDDSPAWLAAERARAAAWAAERGAVAEARPEQLGNPRARAKLAELVSRWTEREPEKNAASRGQDSANARPLTAPRKSRAVRSAKPTAGSDRAVSSSVDDGDRAALVKNPRILSYWRKRARAAHIAQVQANRTADRGSLQQLSVPRQMFDLTHDVCDELRAVAGVVEWIRQMAGPAVMLEVEAAALYRVPGRRQIDDWTCTRARRKLALLMFLLMSPWELKRREVTGSTSDEPIIVTAGVPQTLLVKMLRPSLREPYNVRTLQRDLAEIDECTDLLLRWRTPRCKAQSWETQGESEGVVNRYCMRAGMIRDAYRRARDAADALVKQVRLQMASWLVWQPPPRRGVDVPIVGALAPP